MVSQPTLFMRRVSSESNPDMPTGAYIRVSAEAATLTVSFSELEARILMKLLQEESLHGFFPIVPILVSTDVEVQNQRDRVATESPWIEMDLVQLIERQREGPRIAGSGASVVLRTVESPTARSCLIASAHRRAYRCARRGDRGGWGSERHNPVHEPMLVNDTYQPGHISGVLPHTKTPSFPNAERLQNSV